MSETGQRGAPEAGYGAPDAVPGGRLGGDRIRDRGAGRTIENVAFWRALTKPARYAALVAGAVPALAFPAPNLEFVAGSAWCPPCC